MQLWKRLISSSREQKQNRKIHEVERRTEAESRIALRRKKELKDQITELEDDLAELTLTVQALMQTLEASGALDLSSFETTIQEIDAQDGVVDGKVTPERDQPNAKPKAPAPRKRPL